MTKENHLKNKNERIDYMKKLKKGCMIVIIILIIFMIVGGIILFRIQKKNSIFGTDDWKFNQKESSTTLAIASSMDSSSSKSSVSSSKSTSSSESYLGYTVGGASNVDNFRENIKNNYLPITTDITYNGLRRLSYFSSSL